MKNLILALLSDPLGMSRSNYRTLMDILSDEEGEDFANLVENAIEEVVVLDHKRFRFKENAMAPHFAQFNQGDQHG